MRTGRKNLSLLLACVLAASPGTGAWTAFAGEAVSRPQPKAPILLRFIPGAFSPKSPVLTAGSADLSRGIKAIDAAIPTNTQGVPRNSSFPQSAVSHPQNPAASGTKAGGAESQLERALEVARDQDQENGKPAAEDSTQAKVRQDRFWSGASESNSLDSPPVPGAEGSQKPGLSSGQALSQADPARPAKKSRAAALLGAAAVPTASPALPHWLGSFLTQYAPYLKIGAAIAGTYVLDRAVRWGVEKVGGKLGWDRNTISHRRLLARIATWALGLWHGLHAVGVSTHALVAILSAGGVAFTMVAKEFVGIGNFIEGIKLLLRQPFVLGDRIMISGVVYKVKDMTLRYALLEREDGAITHWSYTGLAEKPITIFKAYTHRHQLNLAKPKFSFAKIIQAARETPKADLRKATLWVGLGIALLFAFPALKAVLALSLFNAVFPFLEGGAVLFLTKHAETWLTGVITRLGEKLGKSSQVILPWKLAGQGLVYLLGGGIALRIFGLTWTDLLTALGATSIAIGWASADIIGNLSQGFWILVGQPFKIGDVIEISGIAGTVVDMDLYYVILEHSDKSHTLVPYSVIKAQPFTVLDKEKADTSPPKPGVPTAIPTNPIRAEVTPPFPH